ncbi:hypothetical protein AMURIS_03075 [Acetatifactor muris]|uniref:Uncharacterized protein n=1 Tax=Acetatifactor muris TaxID=879566 RepID=A0A2K4ZIP4_9FIRM|nr:hypothetical protein AMURIS_03075 [Acetatifactor muris]
MEVSFFVLMKIFEIWYIGEKEYEEWHLLYSWRG